MRLLIFAVALCLMCSQVSFAKISKDEYQRAVDFFKEAQFNEAIAVLKASLDQDPDQAMIYNLLGMIYLKQNESVQSAIGSFEQALRIDPNYADAYFNLASTYAGAANRPELAAEYFKKTLEVNPRYVKAYFGLGWFTLTTREKPEEAAEYFHKAIAYFPDFAEAYYGLGLSYIQMGKAPLALESISKIRTLGREDLAAYLESVLRGGKVSEALKDEVKNEPSSESVSPTLPGSAESVTPSLGTNGTVSRGTSSSEKNIPPDSENKNPFQLD